MDDAEVVNCSAFEATAALLALGPQLDWKSSRSRYYHDVTAIHSKGSGWYQVRPDTEGSHYFAMFICDVSNVSYKPTMLATETLAKAACERHHATGKWE